jgi:hypothetical protein
MGYMTDFKLNVFEGDADSIAQDLTTISTYEWDDSLELYDAKWYNHHEDMIALSKLYPNALFCLAGSGEESGDLWKAYYKNGKSQYCEVIMTYEPYDESKLK